MQCNRILCSTFAALLAGGAGAVDLQYGVEAGVGTTDNITRMPANGENEGIVTAGLDFRLLREGRLLNADVEMDLSWFDYRDGTYDSELLGMGRADIRLDFLPERLSWVLQDSFGQSQLNPFEVSTPDNRENINFFSTGPELRMRLGAAGTLTVYGRWSMTDFGDTGLDDERLLGGLSLGRDLSARSRLSLNLSAERVEFDNQLLGSDFDRQSASLRYASSGARTRIAIEGGVTEVHDLGQTNSSPLVDIDISRDLSQRTVLSLRGGIRSSDAATALSVGSEGGVSFSGQPGQISTSDPFESRHASLGWRFAAPRTGFSMTAGWEEEVYETLTVLDRTRQEYEANIWRQLAPRLRLTLRAALLSNDYESTTFDDEEVQLGARLSWNIAGRLYAELDVDRYDHESSDPLQQFDEVRTFLRFAWRNTGRPGD